MIAFKPQNYYFLAKPGKFSKKVLLFFDISSAVADVENASIEVEIALMGRILSKGESQLMQKNISANAKSSLAAILPLQVSAILSTFEAKIINDY